MLKTIGLDPYGIHLVTDAGTLAPLSASYGRDDATKRDTVTWTANAAALVGTAAVNRVISMTVSNGDALVIHEHFQVIAKRGGLIVPKMPTADIPAAHATLNGAIYYDSTTNKFRGCANATWVDLH